MSDDCLKPNQDWTGIFHKSKDYRDQCANCNRGYHGNNWDAHHVLPYTVFGQITDPFIHECINATDYDINRPYSMAGLPTLSAFVLYFSEDNTIPIEKEKEMTVTMRRWETLKQTINQAHKPEFPGNLPVHTPTNWGHTDYNDDVALYLDQKIWKNLRDLKAKKKHPKPEAVKSLLMKAQAHFWSELQRIGNGPGGGGCVGVEENMRNRYDKAKDGWWKPMCMSEKVTSAPTSPSLR